MDDDLKRIIYVIISVKRKKERATGIEPVIKAWEAFVLPLNYARKLKISEKDYIIVLKCCQEIIINLQIDPFIIVRHNKDYGF